MEMPTVVSYSSLLQRTEEQHVDIPVPGGGGRLAGLQGSLPGQSSTAPTVEQIVDIPGGGLQGFRLGSPASSFHSPAGSDDADEAGIVVFALSPVEKKCEGHPALESESASERQLIRAERSSNASCRTRRALEAIR